MPTLKGTKASLFSAQWFLYLVSSINVSSFHSTWLDTFWTDLVILLTNVTPINVIKKNKTLEYFIYKKYLHLY